MARALQNLDTIDGAEFDRAVDEMIKHLKTDQNAMLMKILEKFEALSDWLKYQSKSNNEKSSVYDFLTKINATEEMTRSAYYHAYISREKRIYKDVLEAIKFKALTMQLQGTEDIVQKIGDFLCRNSSLECKLDYDEEAGNTWVKSYIAKGLKKDFTPYKLCWQTILNSSNNSDLSDWCNGKWSDVPYYKFFGDIQELVYVLLVVKHAISRNSLFELMILKESTVGSTGSEFTNNLVSLLKDSFPVSLPFLWDLMNGELDSGSPGLAHLNWTENAWKLKTLECFSSRQEESCEEIKDMGMDALKTLEPSMLSVILTSYSQQQSPVRLCSFSNKIELLSECSHFELADTLSMHMYKCFTFNGKGEFKDQAIHKLGPQRGLTLLLEASDLANVEPVNFGIVIHEPGVTPDIANIHENHIEASSGRATTISLKPTVYTTSDGFNSMSFDKRNCWIDNDEDNHYHEANCIYDFKIAMEARYL